MFYTNHQNFKQQKMKRNSVENNLFENWLQQNFFFKRLHHVFTNLFKSKARTDPSRDAAIMTWPF